MFSDNPFPLDTGILPAVGGTKAIDRAKLLAVIALFQKTTPVREAAAGSAVQTVPTTLW